MDKVLEAALKSLRSLFTPGMLGVFVKSLLITLLALVAFMLVFGLGISYLADLVPWGSLGFLQQLLPFVLFFGAWFFAWMLFPTVLPLIIHFFDDTIIEVIEKQTYPPTLHGKNWPFWQEIRHDMAFMIKTILLNILILPLYLLPVINLIIFYVLNGYLIGNEFFMTVARRHYNLQTATTIRKENSRTIFLAGVLITFLITIPIINLVAPLWGVAMMTHFFHLHARKKRVE